MLFDNQNKNVGALYLTLRDNRWLFFPIFLILSFSFSVHAAPKPWDNGRLRVSDNGRFLQFANGRPFFWLGDTGWLLPERLDRDEADYYLKRCAEAGYNVVQVQTINAVPAINAYGQMSMTDGWDFSDIDRRGVYGYWDHMDYIVDCAAEHGIYIGMVCIWGGLVKGGRMDVEQARSYGRFLAGRYKDKKNIVWIIGSTTASGSTSTCSRAATGAMGSVWETKIIQYPTAQRRTRGCMWTRRGVIVRLSRCSTVSRVTRAYRRGCTTEANRDGQLSTCGAMPIGRCLPARAGIPTATIP